jgi:hypothetical protein
MIIVLTEDGKQVDAFFKNDGTEDRLELDAQSPMAKILVASVDKEEK